MRVEKLLNIMEKFLDALQYEHMCEAFEGKDPIDFMCDDSEEENEIGVPGEDYGCGDPGDKGPQGSTEEESEEEEEEGKSKTKINKNGLPENDLVICVGVDRKGNGIYKFKN